MNGWDPYFKVGKGLGWFLGDLFGKILDAKIKADRETKWQQAEQEAEEEQQTDVSEENINI